MHLLHFDSVGPCYTSYESIFSSNSISQLLTDADLYSVNDNTSICHLLQITRGCSIFSFEISPEKEIDNSIPLPCSVSKLLDRCTFQVLIILLQPLFQCDQFLPYSESQRTCLNLFLDTILLQYSMQNYYWVLLYQSMEIKYIQFHFSTKFLFKIQSKFFLFPILEQTSYFISSKPSKSSKLIFNVFTWDRFLP